MKFVRFLTFYCLAACCLMKATLPVQAQNAYSTYRNARFGTVVQYPSNLLVPQREADNGDGRRFVSRDGDIELSIYAFRNLRNRSVNGEMQRAVSDWKRDGARLTYWKWQGNWFTLSGFVGGDIFYEKTLLRNGVFHTLIWQYPQTRKRQLDEPVTRSVRSFAVGVGLEQPVPRPTPRPTNRPVPRATPRVTIEVEPAPRQRAPQPAPTKKSGY